MKFNLNRTLIFTNLTAVLFTFGGLSFVNGQGTSKQNVASTRMSEPGQGFSVGLGVMRLSDLADETNDRYATFEDDTNLSAVRLGYQRPLSTRTNLNFVLAISKITQPYDSKAYEDVTWFVPEANIAFKLGEVMSFYGGLNVPLISEQSEYVSIQPNLGAQVGFRLQLNRMHVALAWQALRTIYHYSDPADRDIAIRFSGLNLSSGFTF